MQRITNLKEKLFITFCLLLYGVILYLLPISCVFLAVTGVPCLGCGMTRALICALQLRFSDALSFHYMFWAVPFLYIAFLFDGRVFKNKWANTVFFAVIFAGFILNWFLKR